MTIASKPMHAVAVPVRNVAPIRAALGVASLAGLASLAVLAFVVSPADSQLGESVRIMYVHVPSAVATYAGVALTALGSGIYLWKRSQFWDRIAASAAEIAAVFCALTLVTGMLWGRITWGVYWVWDARLTTFTLLFLIILGYLAVRRLPGDLRVRSSRAAILGLVAVVNIPIVSRAVEWWGGLHQGPTAIGTLDAQIDGTMLFTLMFAMVVFMCIFAWLVMQRYRLETLIDRAECVDLDAAIAARRAEAQTRTQTGERS